MAREQKFLYEFCARPLPKIREAVLALDSAHATLAPTWPNSSKFYSYLRLLGAVVNDNRRTDAEAVRQRGLTRFLDVDLARKFLADPGDEQKRRSLEQQVMFLGLAIGEVAGLTRYDVVDLDSIINGEYSFYTDSLMIYTLGCLCRDGATAAELDLVIKLLPEPEGGNRGWLPVDFGLAVIQALAVQVLWLGLLLLTEDQKKFLFSNYFYTAVVVGAPVEHILKSYLDQTADKRDELEKISGYITASLEILPSAGLSAAPERFSEIIKRFIAHSGSAPDALSQEKFIAGYYESGGKDREVYRSWLRDSLRLLGHLG